MSRSEAWMVGVVASTLMASTLLCGCAASPGLVVPGEQGAYHVSVFGARYETQTDTNLKALGLANEYCDKQGKELMFRQSTESSEHTWSPKQEDLSFVCMDPKDPAYMRAASEHIPPVVAQE